MKRPELGQWCEIAARAVKRRQPVKDTQFKRYPFTTQFERRVLPVPARAMFIGWRTVWEGTTRWESDYDEGGRDYGTADFEKTRNHEMSMTPR